MIASAVNASRNPLVSVGTAALAPPTVEKRTVVAMATARAALTRWRTIALLALMTAPPNRASRRPACPGASLPIQGSFQTQCIRYMIHCVDHRPALAQPGGMFLLW